MANKISYDDIIQKDLLDLLGLPEDLSKEKKQEIYLKFYDIVEARAMLRIDTIMEPYFNDWKSILETGDREKITQFLKNHNVDSMKIMLEEAVFLKAQMTFMMPDNVPAEDITNAPVAATV